jgi:hypothetical protein
MVELVSQVFMYHRLLTTFYVLYALNLVFKKKIFYYFQSDLRSILTLLTLQNVLKNFLIDLMHQKSSSCFKTGFGDFNYD